MRHRGANNGCRLCAWYFRVEAKGKVRYISNCRSQKSCSIEENIVVSCFSTLMLNACKIFSSYSIFLTTPQLKDQFNSNDKQF